VKLYTAWAASDGSEVTLIEGTGLPVFSDGNQQPDCGQLLYRITAATWEEAQAIHHLRMGWRPYDPGSAPAKCERCGAIYYPSGSGECWRCNEGA
jgi:hypothetical protein